MSEVIEMAGRSRRSGGRAPGLRPQPATQSSQSSVPNAVFERLPETEDAYTFDWRGNLVPLRGRVA